MNVDQTLACSGQPLAAFGNHGAGFRPSSYGPTSHRVSYRQAATCAVPSGGARARARRGTRATRHRAPEGLEGREHALQGLRGVRAAAAVDGVAEVHREGAAGALPVGRRQARLPWGGDGAPSRATHARSKPEQRPVWRGLDMCWGATR